MGEKVQYITNSYSPTGMLNSQEECALAGFGYRCCQTSYLCNWVTCVIWIWAWQKHQEQVERKELIRVITIYEAGIGKHNDFVVR